VIENASLCTPLIVSLDGGPEQEPKDLDDDVPELSVMFFFSKNYFYFFFYLLCN
jgi:hypothetical protein